MFIPVVPCVEEDALEFCWGGLRDVPGHREALGGAGFGLGCLRSVPLPHHSFSSKSNFRS